MESSLSFCADAQTADVAFHNRLHFMFEKNKTTTNNMIHLNYFGTRKQTNIMRKFYTLIFLLVASANFLTAGNPTLDNKQLPEQPLLFTENKGQIADIKGSPHPDILFTTHSKGVNLFFTKNGISYQFQKKEYPDGYDASDKKKMREAELEQKIKTTTYRMDMELVGASINPVIETESKNEYFENFYLPQCPNGILNVPTFAKITYKEVYPNIDWVVYSVNQEMKYDFVVHPGGDPTMIKVKYNGASEIKIASDGSLLVASPLGQVIDQKPISFQNGVSINSNFELKNELATYRISEYNKTIDLVIDPGLIWATYYGGSGTDVATGVSTDISGNIYLAGYSNSTTAIASSGFQNNIGGGYDVFLVKFNSSGNRLWSTYYGGTGDEDYRTYVATDTFGNVYLTGFTYSTTAIASGGFQDTIGGGVDAFLVKFNSNGSRLWATYYGGSGAESDGGTSDGWGGICTDANGNVFLTGYTTSATNIALGGFQNIYAGGSDAFLVKFNSSGNRLWATYYGGSGGDRGSGVATDFNGNVYLVGSTSSINDIASVGFQDSLGGNYDAFLVKFNSSGLRQWATYYGGSGNEGYDASVTTDLSGNIYLAGFTTSTSNIAAGGFQDTIDGSQDAFLVKFNNSGNRLWATYYNGNGGYYYCQLGITTDAYQNVYLAGNTNSTTNVASGGFQNTYGGGNTDAYLVEFNSVGNRIGSTYYGGSGTDVGWDIAVNGSNNIYMIGYTGTTSNFTSNGFQNVYGGSTDAFLIKFDHCAIFGPSVSPTTSTICIGQSSILTASGGGSYLWNTGSTNSSITVNPISTTTYTVTVTDANSCTATASRIVTVNNLPVANISPTNSTICSSLSSVTLIGSGGGTYLWNTSSTSSSISATPSQLGTVYTVTVTGSNGCSASVSRIVATNPIVSISPVTSSICSGQSITMIASGGGSYSWSTGASSSSITESPTQTTTYTVTVTGSNTCSATASKVVSIYSTPSVSISADGVITANDTISLGDIVQLQLNGSLNATPNIQWSPSTSINNTSIVNPLVYPSTTTTYTVTFVNTNGCTQNASVLVYVPPISNIGNISIATPSGTIALFDTLILNVQLTSVTGLYGLYLKLRGDAAVSSYLTYAGYTVGTLLGTGGSIISTPPVVASGVYDFGITKIGAVPGYSGSGVFYTFKFVTKNITIPNNTNFCFYLDNISAYNTSGVQVGLLNQGPYCFTFTDQLNVWPGDLNNSKTVTTADLLPIGYFYNSTGPARTNATIQWTAQPATLWGYGQTYPNGSVFKVFADSNGDGIISNADQTAIGFNMGQIHAMAMYNDHHERAQSDGDVVVTPTPSNINTTQLPQTITLQVSLNNTGGLNALYGISVNLLLDNTIFDLPTTSIDYTGSIFGTNSVDCLVIHYVTDSSISIGLTRYASSAINGQGLLCTITLQTKSSISGSVSQTQITSFADAANNQAGDPLSVQGSTLGMNLGTNTGIKNLETGSFSFYPNPTNENFYVESNLTEEDLKHTHIVIYNSIGQQVYKSKITQNIEAVSTKTWGIAGLYSVEIKNRDGKIIGNKKLVLE